MCMHDWASALVYPWGVRPGARVYHWGVRPGAQVYPWGVRWGKMGMRHCLQNFRPCSQ